MIKNGYEFVVLFNVESGNLNGGPDADSLPRTDPESGYGIVTDVCLKCEIRNYVETLKEDEPGHKMYIREDIPLNRSSNTAYIELKIDEKGIKELKRKDPQVDQKIWDFMCRNSFNIRAFGVITTTFVKTALDCDQVRGPVQLGFAGSINPIMSREVTITRTAITAERDTENKSTEVGRKDTVLYALYRTGNYISASLARKSTGFSEEDLELSWDTIISMFETSHPTTRGKTAVRRLIVFKRSKELGGCPAYKLFDAVGVRKNEEVEYPRKYGDYITAVHRGQVPVTVEVSEKV